MATYWGGGCSFGLRCIFVVWVPGCWFVFSHLGFLSGNLFLIAPFPDIRLLVPFHTKTYPDKVCSAPKLIQTDVLYKYERPNLIYKIMLIYQNILLVKVVIFPFENFNCNMIPYYHIVFLLNKIC